MAASKSETTGPADLDEWLDERVRYSTSGQGAD